MAATPAIPGAIVLSESEITGEELVTLATVGPQQAVAELSNAVGAAAAQANSGTFTADGTTGVVVAAPAVTAKSQILITLKTVGGTPGAPFLTAITPGTGFTVESVAGDTSVYNYAILG